MRRAFWVMVRLEAAMKINGFLYFLKRVPLLKRLFKNTSYALLDLKSFLGGLGVLYQLLAGPVKSFLLAGLFLVLPQEILGDDMPRSPLILVLGLYMGLRLVSSELLTLNPSKFILLKQLRMNPRSFAGAVLWKKEGIRWISRSAAFLFFAGRLGISWGEALLLSTLVTLSAILAEALHLFYYAKKRDILEEHTGLLVVLYLTLVPGSYLLWFFLPGANLSAFLFHGITVAGFLLVAGLSLRYIRSFSAYGEALHRSTSYARMDKMRNAAAGAQFADVKVKDKEYAQVDLKGEKHAQKKGFDYLNTLFFERHGRFFRKPVLVKSALVVGSFLVFFLVDLFVEVDLLTPASQGILDNYTIFVFLLYMLCNATRETKAMFYNCDLSLLKYGFYRKGDALLAMFTLRLKRIVLGNLIPALLLCGGLLLLAMLSGMPNLLTILPVLVMILALSVFFSVHYLFMYYIFQPYTADLQVKNPFFSLINGLVYFASYMAMQVKTPAAGFLPVIILFALGYIAFALTMVYRKAPQTFRIK